MKTCITCNEELTLFEFNKSNKYKDGRNSACRTCINKIRKTHVKPTHEVSRNAQLFSKYGLRDCDVDEILKYQEHSCAICGVDEADTSRGRLVVDHNHDTGEVRGMLCHTCNGGIGLLRDNPDILEEGARYIRAFA